MTEDFHAHTPTRTGVRAPLATMTLADHISALSSDYLCLPEGQPILVIRHIQNPREPLHTAVIMALAIKPLRTSLYGIQMLTENGFELPVERYALCGGSDEVSIVTGKILIKLNGLTDSKTEIVFGGKEIMKWLVKGKKPQQSQPQSEQQIVLRLLHMAQTIGVTLDRKSLR